MVNQDQETWDPSTAKTLIDAIKPLCFQEAVAALALALGGKCYLTGTHADDAKKLFDEAWEHFMRGAADE